MTYEPMPTQVEDRNKMLEYRHALLWAEAGTGKTITAIDAFKTGGFKKQIILVPKIGLTMWLNEVKEHLGHERVHVIRSGKHAQGKQYSQAMGGGGADAIITTYDLCRNQHVANLLRQYAFKFDGVQAILDEGQAAKNPNSGRGKAVYGDDGLGYCTFMECVDDAHIMSGDFVMSYSCDWYPHLKFARPDLLKHYDLDTYQKFMDFFCIVERKRHNPRQQRIIPRPVGDRNEDLLIRLLREAKVIRRTLAEVDPYLPPVTHRVVEIEVSKVPSSPVRGLSDEQFLKELNNPDSDLAKIRRLLGIAKARGVSEYTVDQKPPLLVGVWHKDVIAAVIKELRDLRPKWVIREVSGSVSSAERDRIQEGFNNGEVHVIVGQISAMKETWNLQKMCRHVIFGEEIPSHGMHHQFMSRVVRKGQEHSVQVDQCNSVHEIDEVLQAIRLRKKATKERIAKGLDNG